MARYVVTGQGTHGPLELPPTRGPMKLWTYYRPPAAGNTLLVYNDGEVVEGWEFPDTVFADPDLYAVLLGGQKHIVDSVADAFLYNSLVTAGYDLVAEGA